jgi:hypothetical protein
MGRPEFGARRPKQKSAPASGNEPAFSTLKKNLQPMVYFAFLFRLMGGSSESAEILLPPSSPIGPFTGDGKPLERPPETGVCRHASVPRKQILADIPGHKRAVMRLLLKSPEFCSTCHKVDAPPSLNGYKHIRGFSAYDEWQQSGASHESLLTFYKRDQRTDCRAALL